MTTTASTLPTHIAFVDLETTGATASADRITEIGIVRVGPQGVSQWSSLVNPQTRISGFIEQLTGISNAMVANAPLFSELADTVREQLAGHVFIAHNARFDYGFLRSEFARLGGVFRAPVLCTVKLSRKLYPQHYKHSLDALIERHALTVSARHRALGDAQLIHEFWQQHVGDERLATCVAELCAQSQLPAHLEARLTDDLPEGRGVYVFYDADERVIHVARSKTLRSKVLSYFSTLKPPPLARRELAARAQRIVCHAMPDEGQALLFEAELRRRLVAPHTGRE
jgi:DNA polymerase III subunit epsilon